MSPSPRAHALDALVRAGGVVVGVWGGVLLALFGAFLTPFRVGAVLVPVAPVVAVGGNTLLIWFALRATEHKFLALLPGLVWVVVTFAAVDRTTEGDLVLYQQNWVSMVYLLSGMATVAFAGYRLLVPQPPPIQPR